MKMRTILLSALCLAAVTGFSYATEQGAAAPDKQQESYGDTQIVSKDPVKSMFNHKTHVVSAGLTCDRCHPSLFERKQGAAKAKGDYNMASLDAGKYCGACHNGKTAFNTTGPETCKVCHGSDMKPPEQVIFNKPVKAVVFGHKEHVAMGLNCASCHDQEFEMRVGAAEENPGKFTMQAMYAGKYCGVCHNGNIAFAANTRCASCHIGVKGLEKMNRKAALEGGEKKY